MSKAEVLKYLQKQDNKKIKKKKNYPCAPLIDLYFTYSLNTYT